MSFSQSEFTVLIWNVFKNNFWILWWTAFEYHISSKKGDLQTALLKWRKANSCTAVNILYLCLSLLSLPLSLSQPPSLFANLSLFPLSVSPPCSPSLCLPFDGPLSLSLSLSLPLSVCFPLSLCPPLLYPLSSVSLFPLLCLSLSPLPICTLIIDMWSLNMIPILFSSSPFNVHFTCLYVYEDWYI